MNKVCKILSQESLSKVKDGSDSKYYEILVSIKYGSMQCVRLSMIAVISSGRRLKNPNDEIRSFVIVVWKHRS